MSYTLIGAPDRAMRELAAVSERNNAWLGIARALHYDLRRFFQVTEDDPAHVDLLCRRIAADPRHRDMAPLDRAPPLRALADEAGRWPALSAPYPHLTGLFGYDSLRKAGALALERRMALLARL